jgi:hypothetical protein
MAWRPIEIAARDVHLLGAFPAMIGGTPTRAVMATGIVETGKGIRAGQRQLSATVPVDSKKETGPIKEIASIRETDSTR